MAIKEFNQEFKGYYREPNKSGLPNISGVYCVYECTHNTDNTVTLHRLIYIGESEDINHRISNHEKLKDWNKYLNPGNELCYAFTAVDEDNRIRVEAAYIFAHTPPVNTEYTNNFPFDQTIVKSTGTFDQIKDYFTVNRT